MSRTAERSGKPAVIDIDKAPTYGIAISGLKAEGKCPGELLRRQAEYLNNVVEAGHGKPKQPVTPVRGVKTLKAAYATLKGVEAMQALRKGQMTGCGTAEGPAFLAREPFLPNT